MENSFDAKTLQAKLEKFAGFKEVRFKEPPYEVAWIEDKDGNMFTDGVPDLVNSLDAQYKYLWPILQYCYTVYSITFDNLSVFTKTQVECILVSRDYGTQRGFYGDTPMLAFAFAVEKLIDKLEQNNVGK
ncbi:MAG: hypothetical protein WC389_22540 [Lutibacter sp.]|jgi:hypothetical protein